jgi:hypothetical protein
MTINLQAVGSKRAQSYRGYAVGARHPDRKTLLALCSLHKNLETGKVAKRLIEPSDGENQGLVSYLLMLDGHPRGTMSVW